jgi:ubiquinone/menaquinone biosynthesis C-methylase UbiE
VPDPLAGFPEGFAPDLRRPGSWPSLAGRWRLWGDPALTALTYAELHRLIQPLVPGRGLAILDVGCGSGFLSLELARAGHRVTGIDPDPAVIALARRAQETERPGVPRDRLEYQVAGVHEWEVGAGRYDLVVFCRSLHHVADPADALAKAARWLSPEGRLVCLEFAYDRFDHRAAGWLCRTRRLCALAGWVDLFERPGVSPVAADLDTDLDRATEATYEAWMRWRRDHGLNAFEAMRAPLTRLFRQAHWSWHPYLHWEILQDMRVPVSERAGRAAQAVLDAERWLIGTEQLTPVLFAFAGMPL